MTLDALLADFTAPPEGAWRAALAAELKGADPERLNWSIDAGISIPPLVTADDAREADAFARVAAALAPREAVRFVSAMPDSDGDVVDEEAWHVRGASPVTALAASVRELRAAPGAAIRTSVGPNVLLETARLRALRVLAARIRVDAGLGADASIHASTARFWMTRAAPHTNLLRATSGAVAATLGGANTATVRAHVDLGAESDIEAARRIASAIPHLLAHEGLLGGADAASVATGAYAIDLLAYSLATAAWALAASGDDLDAHTTADLTAVHERVASGRLRLVGTNAYASADDRLLPAWNAGRRAAEPVEAAREAVERARTEHGTPSIVLLRFGDAAMGTARATFARGLLAMLGLPCDETTDVEVAESARFVVLCSSDADVQAHAPEIARRLASSCAPPTVFVAGPEDATLRARRVHGFVHARMPALAAAQHLADAAFEAHGAPGACSI